MSETPSCTYNVQKQPDAERTVCGKRGVKRATTQRIDMVYCTLHWKAAEGRLKDYHAVVVDLD